MQYFLVKPTLYSITVYLLDPWQLPEGSSMKQDLSILPSYSLSGCFLGIGIGARDPFEVVRDRAGVLGKKLFFTPKIREMGQKQTKNSVF